jgi:UDP-N-acetylglucosamine 1-carboxyvinyltransferase
MVSFIIQGGRTLKGQIRASGAKNSTLPIMAAALLTRGECVIRETPDLKDVGTMIRILTSLGAKVWVGVDASSGQRYIRIVADSLSTYEIPADLMIEMRSSIVLMGVILARLGRVRLSRPGGCSIGSRPINFHLQGLRLLGAEVREKHGYIDAETTGLVGREVHLDFPSVTTTENLMMAAVHAEGTTLIKNASKEPEVVDLQNFLNAMGARIVGSGSDSIRINGSRGFLHGVEHTVIPDRIEVGTYLVAGAITAGDVTVTKAVPEHLEAVTAKLREAGAELEIGRDFIRILPGTRLRPVDFKTLPYPGFPTDMQPQAMAMTCYAQGTSVITENIFDQRFAHADELVRMGGSIEVGNRLAVVRGVGRLSGARVRATDLRAGAALVLAGLGAEDTTIVEQGYHIERGYEKIDEKLRGVGASIVRAES